MRTKTIRVFTAFSGYDSQMMALKRLEKDYPEVHFDLVGWCECDEDAINSHNAVFPEYADRHYPDITKVDWTNVPDFDLFFYSSCCQDISSAGYQAGLKKGSGTRSSLIWCCLDAIRTKKPKYAILENVKALVSDKFYEDFISWQRSVDDLGYTSNWQVLNASNYDIPQSRERIFMFSVRKDATQMYYFPSPIKKTKQVSDFIEKSEVDKKYYTDDTKLTQVINYFCGNNDKDIDFSNIPDSSNYKGHKVAQMVTNLCVNECIPTITTTLNGVEVKNCISGKSRYNKLAILETWESETYDEIESTHLYKSIADSIKVGTRINASNQKLVDAVKALKPNQYLKIRRPTPSELFRFMGVSESDIVKLISSGVKSVELVKQAGNSIVVDVLYHLFRTLFVDVPSSSDETADVDLNEDDFLFISKPKNPGKLLKASIKEKGLSEPIKAISASDAPHSLKVFDVKGDISISLKDKIIVVEGQNQLLACLELNKDDKKLQSKYIAELKKNLRVFSYMPSPPDLWGQTKIKVKFISRDEIADFGISGLTDTQSNSNTFKVAA